MKDINGVCSVCNGNLVPIWFIKEEYRYSNGIRYKTGRKKRAVDYLCCQNCFHTETVDDSFDENWH